MKNSSVVLACLLLTGACSKVKELDKRTQNMESSTKAVSTTTVQMNETTKQLAEMTNDLKNTTETMYRQIRSKEAEATREEKFKVLMGSEEEMGSRITAAGVFFKSLEFQLFTSNGTFDNQEVKELLYVDAANEFTRKMCDLYSKIKVKKMSPTTENKMEMSFYAVAAAMHMNHTYHDLVSKERGEEAVSFYDLIKTALIKDQNGERLLEHEEILLNGINKEIMIELVKARVDILSALGLKNLTDKRDMTLGQKMKALVFKITGGKLGSIDLPEVYDKSNDATKLYTEKYLDGAVKAKDFLEKKINTPKQLEKTIRSAFKNIDFNESGMSEEEKKGDSRKETIKGLITKLLE